MENRIVISIHNSGGELVAYAGRALEECDEKYRLPKGFLKTLELFNVRRVLPIGRELVIVVEGFFDAVKVHSAGYPSVVALMGSFLSKEQNDMLAEFSKVILLLDGDEAGREATKKLRRGSCGGHL